MRIEAVLRRVKGALRTTGEGTLRCGDLALDTETRYVFKGEAEVTLTRTEFELLRYLMMNVGRVVTRAQIIERVWSFDYEGDTRVVESYISALRRKVDFAEPSLIHTVRGVGYSIRPPRP